LEQGHQCYAIEGVNFGSAEDAVCRFCQNGVACPITQRELRGQQQCQCTSATPRDWRQCSEYYLKNVWLWADRQFIREFSTSEVSCAALHDLCVKYGVARTVPGYISEAGIEGKYRAFADMLNKYRNIIMTQQNVPQIMKRETDNMWKAYGGRTFESAISKALWMMKLHPVVIYDAYAWYGLQAVGLKPRDYSYRAYFDSWFRFFEQRDTRVALDDAVRYLMSLPPTQELIGAGTISAADIDSPWFRNRITDVRLWFLGGAKP
jgi:hypothetical protein